MINTISRDESKNLPIIVVLAAHDDGAGAHTFMCNVRDGLLSGYYNGQKREKNIFFIYLHGGDQSGFREVYWKNPRKIVNASKYKWAMVQSGSAIIPPQGIDGVWIKVDNHLQFSKTPDGSLDAAETRKNLAKASRQITYWPHVLENLPPDYRNNIKLTVEMGVPQLTQWASTNKIPSIAVGDMLWSRAMRGSLKPAGEFDSDAEKSLHTIAEMERLIKEVWLLPILAPKDYQDYLSDIKVVYQCLPGLIGSRPSEADVKSVAESLQDEYVKLSKMSSAYAIDGYAPEKVKLIVMAAGNTSVWKNIYSTLEAAFINYFPSKTVNHHLALAYPSNGCIKIIHCGKAGAIPDPGDMTKLFANTDLCVTRGGVTIVEVIAAGKPFVVVQEPNHFLSQRQQEAAADRGLCFTAGLSQFQDSTEVIKKLVSWANDDENAKLVKERCEQFDFDIEDRIGRQLVNRFLS